MTFRFAHESFDQETLAEINRAKWFHRIELANGFFTNSTTDVSKQLDRTCLPNNLDGAVCIDIGTRVGGLAFEMEKRGAHRVIANDWVKKSHFNFELAHRCIGSKVEFLQADLSLLPFINLPECNIVIYSGVIYHIADPYMSLMCMREICHSNGVIVVESAVLDAGTYSFETKALKNDKDEINEILSTYPNLLQYLPRGHVNSWVPSIDALRSLCEDAGLEITQEARYGGRVMLSTKIRGAPRFPSFYQQHPVRTLLKSVEPDFS